MSLLKALQSEELAKALDNSRLEGSLIHHTGLRPVWQKVEHILHDMTHLVVLRRPVLVPEKLENQVHAEMMCLSLRERLNNERMTLAVEVLFLRKYDAFVEPAWEHLWLHAVANDVELKVPPIRRHMETPKAKMYLRRLERRLLYHARMRNG